MSGFDDYHAFESTSGGSGGGKTGGGCGCLVWVLIGIFVYMLIYFLANGASWDAIECLLAFGLIAFLIVRSLFR